MLIVGAKGFAKEVLEIFHQKNESDGLCFYDDVSDNFPDLLYNQFKVLKTESAAKDFFENTNTTFTIGIGNPKLRFLLYKKFTDIGGVFVSVISKFAEIGSFGVEIGEGCTIMGGVRISNEVKIGKGTMVYYNSIITHDVEIGDFCELSPSVNILGRVKIGNFTHIATGAIIFPDVKIGNNVIIGAGSVIHKDVPHNSIIINKQNQMNKTK